MADSTTPSAEVSNLKPTLNIGQIGISGEVDNLRPVANSENLKVGATIDGNPNVLLRWDSGLLWDSGLMWDTSSGEGIPVATVSIK